MNEIQSTENLDETVQESLEPVDISEEGLSEESPLVDDASEESSDDDAKIEDMKKNPRRVLYVIALQTLLFVVAPLLVAWKMYADNSPYIGSTGLDFVWTGVEPANVLDGLWTSQVHSLDIATTLILSVILGFFFWGINVAISAAAYISSEKYRKADEKSNKFNSILIDMPLGYRIMTFAVSAFGEEVLFRWFLFSSCSCLVSALFMCEPAYAFVAGAVASSIVFSLVHLQYKHPAQFFDIFFMGCILCAAFVATGNILAPFIMHFMNNFLFSIASRKLKKKLDAYLEQKGVVVTQNQDE